MVFLLRLTDFLALLSIENDGFTGTFARGITKSIRWKSHIRTHISPCLRDLMGRFPKTHLGQDGNVLLESEKAEVRSLSIQI